MSNKKQKLTFVQGLKAQFSTKTLTTKLGEPGRFTIEELYAILDALEIRVAFIRKPQPL